MAIAHIDVSRVSHPIRVGPDGWQYGEPYDVFTTLEVISPGVGRIIGLDKPVSKEQWLAIAVALDAIGIRQVTWERIIARGAREGTQRMKVIDITWVLERGADAIDV